MELAVVVGGTFRLSASIFSRVLIGFRFSAFPFFRQGVNLALQFY